MLCAFIYGRAEGAKKKEFYEIDLSEFDTNVATLDGIIFNNQNTIIQPDSFHKTKSGKVNVSCTNIGSRIRYYYNARRYVWKQTKRSNVFNPKNAEHVCIQANEHREQKEWTTQQFNNLQTRFPQLRPLNRIMGVPGAHHDLYVTGNNDLSMYSQNR
jgi:hypothetical protein